ncbi:MAG: ABC transporter substrate-binding protein, partial [Candidatus Bathyarchaeia archaeon]
GSIHWTGTPVGGSVSWHLPGPVATFHPYLATSVYENTILSRLSEGLLEISAYTHQDVFWLATNYKIEEWTGPSGEPGMLITWWIRSDIKWQDGDPVKADDFIWQYEFINSIQPSQLYNIWSTYHGCIKHNDYCFSIKVNATGQWTFYYYTGGPVYPRKVWQPFYGDKAAAEAFKPWQTPHPEGKLPTSLYGTGEWIYHYYDSVLSIVRMYKNTNWWARQTAMPCRQIPSLHAPTTANKGIMPKVTKATVGLYTFNLDTKENQQHTWTLKIDGKKVANGSRTLSPLEYAKWYEAIPWQTLSSGSHIFTLETTNVYGVNAYTMIMYVLIGDVDNNNIVNMLDLYTTAKVVGQTGDPCWSPYDVDNNGIINMLDIYMIAVLFGRM